jgi:general secretion pathway protein D
MTLQYDFLICWYKRFFKKIFYTIGVLIIWFICSSFVYSEEKSEELVNKAEVSVMPIAKDDKIPFMPVATDDPMKIELKNKAELDDEKATIYLNFEDAALSSVLNFIAEEKKINLLPHKDLENVRVSLSTRNPLTLERAWTVLLTLLEMKGFSIIRVGGIYRIVSNKENSKHPLPTYSSKTGTEPEHLPDSDLVIRYVYFFNNMKPDIASNILSNMFEGEGSLQINQDLQAAIIKEKCFNIKAAMKIIKELDTGGLRESIKIITLKETNPDSVARLFDEIIGEKERTTRFFSLKGGKETVYFSADTKIISYPAKNALILLGTEKNLEKITNFVYKYIDIPSGSAESRLHIKEIRYAKAESFKTILDGIINRQESDKKILVGKYKLFEDVIISTEEVSEGSRGGGNRLIVACNRDDWKRLCKIIDRLDRPQPQIAFEVMIVDVGEEQAKALGTQTQTRENIGMGINCMQFKNLDSGVGIEKKEGDVKKETKIKRFIELADILGAGSPAFLTFGRAGAPDNGGTDIWAIIRSAFRVLNSHIITQPYLVTNNGQECIIDISQTKKVQGALTPAGKNDTAKETKEDKKAGTIVILTPYINTDGVVDLKIKIDVDEFIAAAGGLTDSSITRREINTKTSVLAGEVLVLGGIKKSNLAENIYKTPVLGDIPIIGNLFKSKGKIKTESNLYVFIRPSIIKPKFDGIPDEYTQLKLDYAKYQMFKNDTYVKDKDPIQRWFFRPTHGTVHQRLADAGKFKFPQIDNFTYGKQQPRSVNIKEDPYFKVSESIKHARAKLKQRN